MGAGLRAATAMAAVLLLTACASQPPVLLQLTPEATAAVELTEVAFFPQTDFQCGPAALATVLHSAGVAADPDVLADQVYVPARQGSLQVELQAATRRAARIPYIIDSSLAALRDELDAGRPVLVLQNLGLGILPAWHYAVVIGIQPGEDRVILRSGTERRRFTPARAFLRSWRLGGSWAMVALRAGELPAVVDRARYLQAVAQAERYLPADARRDAYQAALTRWPGNPVAQFGLAYALQVAGDQHGAEAAYRALIGQYPRHAAAYNNLAEVLSARGCHAQARSAATQALEIAGGDYPGLVDVIKRTLQKVPLQGDEPRCTQALPANRH